MKKILNAEELKLLSEVIVPSGIKEFDLVEFKKWFDQVDLTVKEKWFDNEYEYNDAVAHNNHIRGLYNKIVSVLNSCSNKDWDKFISDNADLIMEYRQK